MANPFELEELTDLRRFAGYGQPIGDETLSTRAQALEDRLAAMTDDQAEAVRANFLTPLREQEAALLNSYKTLNVASVGNGAFERNENELADRMKLLKALREALVAFIGVPAGPQLAPATISSGRVVR